MMKTFSTLITLTILSFASYAQVGEDVKWVYTDEGKYCRFYKERSFEIIKFGKIMVYRFTEVNALFSFYYSNGNHRKLIRIRIIRKSLGAKLFSDDKEIIKRFEDLYVPGLAGINNNYLNLLTCIDLYNLKYKKK